MSHAPTSKPSAKVVPPKVLGQHEKVSVLAEALPYMQRYDGKTIVVKFGGNAMGDPECIASFACDVTLLRQSGARPIVVHGGGPQIGRMLNDLGVETRFNHGLRVTDARTMDVAEMVLCGSINKEIVQAIQLAGGQAVGCSGKDGGMIEAVKWTPQQQVDTSSNMERVVDLGFVGTPERVSTRLLTSLLDGGFIPVVAPVGANKEGDSLNINADTAAGAIAVAMGAERLLLLSDVSGVCDEAGERLARLSENEAAAMIRSGEIHGGMIPKVETGIHALKGGVSGAVILDGRQKHAMLLELFTEDGSGTLLHE